MLRVIISGLAGVAVLYYWRLLRVGPNAFGHLKHLFIIGAPIFGVGELNSWWSGYLSRTLVWAYLGAGSVGLYSLVLQAATALDLLPLAVAQVIYPRMAEKYGQTGRIQGLLGMTIKPIAVTAAGMVSDRPGVVAGGPGRAHGLARFHRRHSRHALGNTDPFLSSFVPVNLMFHMARRQDLYVVAIILGMLTYGGCLLWLVRRWRHPGGVSPGHAGRPSSLHAFLLPICAVPHTKGACGRMTMAPTFPVEVLRDIEAQLSLPLFRGVPVGPTLGNICAVELYEGHGKWNFAARWKDLHEG